MRAIKRGDIAIVVGLMAYCAMLRSRFVGVLASGGVDSFVSLRFLYDASLWILGFLLALQLLKGVHAALSSNRSALAAVSGILAVLGVVTLVFGQVLEGPDVLLGIVGAVAVSLGFVGLTLVWFTVLSAYPRERIAVLVLEAFVLSHLFFVVDLLPREASSNLSMVYPVISSAALVFALKKDESWSAGGPWSAGEEPSSEIPTTADQTAPEPSGQTPAASGQTPPPAASTQHSDYFKRMRLFALVLIAVEVFCGALLRSRWVVGGAGYGPATNTISTYLVSAAIGIVFLVVAKRAKSTSEEALVIGALGLMGFTVTVMLFSVLPISVLSPVVTGLYSALLVFSMALLVLWGNDGDYHSMRTAGVFLSLYGFVSVVSTVVIPAIFQYRGVMPEEHLAPVGVMAGLVISLGVGVALFFMVVVHRGSYLKAIEEVATSLSPLFPEEYLAADVTPAFFTGKSSEPKTQELSAREIHDLAMEKVAADYGLTQRERQAASLIAQGYSFKRVAEELCVVPGTIQGYSKSIYRKMGVHKKDELIEIVDEAKHSL